MTDNMKSCVRILKAENKIICFSRRIGKIPDKILGFLLTSVLNLTNWCMVRSIMRWGGIPLSFVAFYILTIADDMDVSFFAVAFCSFIIVLMATLASWMFIPYEEQKILFASEGYDR